MDWHFRPTLADHHDQPRIIAVVTKAQQPDGYLATQVTLRDRERFAVNAHHELYTMGHLLTAACAHYRITGKTNLLDVAKRVADYVHSAYQSGDPKMINCPLNPSIIMGTVELYRPTGNKKYLDLANIVIDNRGEPKMTVQAVSADGDAVIGRMENIRVLQFAISSSRLRTRPICMSIFSTQANSRPNSLRIVRLSRRFHTPLTFTSSRKPEWP